MPPSFWKRRREEQRRFGKEKDSGDKMEERPTNHVSEFCDMCQSIIRQGLGKNCRQWRVIRTKVQMFEEDGSDVEDGGREVIVDMQHLSNNPFHYNATPAEKQEGGR